MNHSSVLSRLDTAVQQLAFGFPFSNIWKVECLRNFTVNGGGEWGMLF